MAELFLRMKPYIQPFERELAVREVLALTGCKPMPSFKKDREAIPLIYKIEAALPPDGLSARLTYWEQVSAAETVDLTSQVKREATVYLVRNGVLWEELQDSLPFKKDVPLPNRRVLRYGSHGIHEYRGKFFPQLVRSLLNIARITPDCTVLDPMCGSGTTPVEAILLGCKAVGVDLNPMSVLMSKAKCNILAVDPSQLITEHKLLKGDITKLLKGRHTHLQWFGTLPLESQRYLINWFGPEILSDLDTIALRVHETKNQACRQLFQVSLSNILRNVSWQKTDDLRVRKEVRADVDFDIAAEYFSELNRSVNTVLAFLYQNRGYRLGEANIVLGDFRKSDILPPHTRGTVDAIVTSPPYATALPYLDTDRLSLYFLGLLSRAEHRKSDLDMIGNREITNGYRKKYLDKYESRKKELPDSVITLIDTIISLNTGTDAGFRRQNLPALLFKYFLDMKKVFKNFSILLKPNASAYVVVGNNHTVAGGQRIEIETDKLLAELGESVGLKLEETVSMEMLTSRDIFKKNASSAETIIRFKN